MKLENITFSYDKNPLFKDFNLDLNESKVTCILGPSGVGKTTLLNILLKQNSNLKMSYVYQTPRLIESVSVYKNLEFVMADKDIEFVKKTLSNFKILDCINKKPKELSGGQASRVSICRALVYNPNILILDEPFKDLDIGLKKELLLLLSNSIVEKKLGAVYVTHDIDEALYMADRIIVLKDKPVKVDLDINIDIEHDQRVFGSDIFDKLRHKVYASLTNMIE